MRPTEDQIRSITSRPHEYGPGFTGRSLLVGLADSLCRNWRWLLSIGALITLAAAAYWTRVPKDYESEMTFLVRNTRAEVVVNPDGSSSMQQRQADVSDAQISTEVQMLTSRVLAEKILPATGFTGPDSLDREEALNKLTKDVQVSPVVKSNMIRVRYSHRDPQRVTAVLDSLATAYLDEHLQLHGNSGSFDFFDQQSKEAEKRWKDAQQQLLDFQQKAAVVSAADQKDLLLRRQIELQTNLNQAEADLKEVTRRMDSIRPRLQAMATRVDTQARKVPNQYSAERLSTMLAELQNKRTELLVKYRATERVVTQVDQQIADTQRAFEEALSRVATEQASDVNPLRQTLESELSKSEGAEAGLRGRIQTMQAQNQAYRLELIKLDRILPQEQQLQRQVKVTEDNYLLYAKRREEARIGQRMDEQKIANVVLSEKAHVPLAPKSRLGTVATVYVLAMLITVLAVALLARMKRTVQTPWELEAVSDVPVLGTVPVHQLTLLPERMRGFSS